MEDDRHYWQENILIHEFAHSIMCIGMDQEQRQSIEAAFEEAKAAKLYQSHIYMMANADEYWAEATQSWFDATVRTGEFTFHVHNQALAYEPAAVSIVSPLHRNPSQCFQRLLLC